MKQIFSAFRAIKKSIGNIINHETLITVSSFFSQKKGTRDSIRETNSVIISLTSIPSRINKLHIVIESLLRQSPPPDRLILWLSEYDREGKKVLDKNHLPYLLKKQQQRGLEIHFCDDIRSYRKLLPTIELSPHSAIVTADDDTIYPKKWLEVLYDLHLIHPKQVICYRGVKISFDNNDSLLPYQQWPEFLEAGQPSRYLFPQGGEGTLYPPNVFSKEAFNEDVFMKICLTADDVWFKAMSLYNGNQCIKVEPKHQDFERLRNSQTDDQTLHYINNELGQNDIQINAVFNKYGLISQLKNNT